MKRWISHVDKVILGPQTNGALSKFRRKATPCNHSRNYKPYPGNINQCKNSLSYKKNREYNYYNYPTRNLRASLGEHLSMLFLVAKHGCPERKREAEAVLARHKDISFHIVHADQKANCEEDWNRMGWFALSSIAKLEDSLKAVDSMQETLSKKEVGEALRNVGEVAALCRKRKRASEKKKADGRQKVSHVQGWLGCVAKARKELGLPPNATFPKGSALYSKAKALQTAGD